MTTEHQGSISIWWVNYENGPDVVLQGSTLGGITIDADFALVVGDDPLVVFEGDLDDLARFHARLGVAIANARRSRRNLPPPG